MFGELQSLYAVLSKNRRHDETCHDKCVIHEFPVVQERLDFTRGGALLTRPTKPSIICLFLVFVCIQMYILSSGRVRSEGTCPGNSLYCIQLTFLYVGCTKYTESILNCVLLVLLFLRKG